MHLVWMFLCSCHVYVLVETFQERTITSSFCYGFLQNWDRPSPANVTLECNENETIQVERVQVERPNMVGDVDLTSMDPKTCSRDRRNHVMDESACLARHRLDGPAGNLQTQCNRKQYCHEMVGWIFMHEDNLKNAVNCDKLKHDCLETLMMNRTISCYARRLHVTYRCTSRQNMADNSLNSDITTPLYDYSTPTIMTNTENPISDVGEGLKRCDIICYTVRRCK